MHARYSHFGLLRVGATLKQSGISGYSGKHDPLKCSGCLANRRR